MYGKHADEHEAYKQQTDASFLIECAFHFYLLFVSFKNRRSFLARLYIYIYMQEQFLVFFISILVLFCFLFVFHLFSGIFFFLILDLGKKQMFGLHYFCGIIQFLNLKRISVRFFVERMATTAPLQALHRRTDEANVKRKNKYKDKSKNLLAVFSQWIFPWLLFFFQFIFFLPFF